MRNVYGAILHLDMHTDRTSTLTQFVEHMHTCRLHLEQGSDHDALALDLPLPKAHKLVLVG